VRLGDLLAPLAVAEFLDAWYGIRPLHVPGAPGRFESLTAGRPGIAALARRLEFELEAPVTVEPARGEKDPPAPAARDTLALQLAGETRWSVYPDLSGAPGGEACCEAVVAAGGLLYVPRGFWMGAKSTAESTACHFAIGNPTGVEMVDWIAGVLRRDAAFQRDIPRFAGPAAQADWQDAVCNSIAALCGIPGLTQRYARHLNESLPPHAPSGVPWSEELSLDHVIEIASRRPWTLRRASEGVVYLVSNGKPLVFDDAAVPLLEFLTTAAPVSLDTFYEMFAAEFDRVEMSEFLSVMAANGLISMQAPGSVF
jgi:hypothetical protein